MSKPVKNFATNCQVCSKELLNYQLRPGKVGSVIKDLCDNCYSQTDDYDNFKKAIELLNDLRKNGQADSEVESPNVLIEPMNAIIQKAVNLLKRMDSNYFTGVRKIVAGVSSNYGHVESGPNKDPYTININLQKITSNVNSGDSKDLTIATALVIAHERGHLQGFEQEKTFKNEGFADAEEDRIKQWIESNKESLSNIL